MPEDNASFRHMLQDIGKYNDLYRSFTNGKTYRNLIGKTASGLLKDAAAETRNLSPKAYWAHKYSQEVFAAFCMFFCAQQIQKRFPTMAKTQAGDISHLVYFRVLKKIREDLEAGKECVHVRNLIQCAARNAMLDLIEKNAKYTPLEITSDDGEEKLSEKVMISILAGARDAMEKEKKLCAVEEMLEEAARKDLLSDRELFSLCSYYGLGDFKKLTNNEIAEKLGVSAGTATRMRSGAIEELQAYIERTQWLREEFL